MIKNFEDTSGVTIKFKYLLRREGDLPAFLANTSKALKKVSWRSEKNIKNVCEDTWRWHKKTSSDMAKRNKYKV